MRKPLVIDRGDHIDLFIRQNAKTMTVLEMAKTLGITFYAVQKHLKTNGLTTRYRPKHPWSDEDIKLAVNMFTNGETTETISEKIGRSPIAVNLKLYYLGYRNKTRNQAITKESEGTHLILGKIYTVPCQWEWTGSRRNTVKEMQYIGISGGKYMFKSIKGGWVTSLTPTEIKEQIKEEQTC